MTVKQMALFAGKRLVDLRWREKYGVNIAYIKRGEKIIHAPGAQEILMPFDEVGIISTEEQMQIFKTIFESTENLNVDQVPLENIVLQKVIVDENNRLKNMSIRESGIRERTSGLIIGIERKGEWLLNPESDIIFEWDDIIWIVGDRKKIQNLANSKTGNKIQAQTY
jgi:CPA2 family monovalent cation:H+ antiporter-2